MEMNLLLFLSIFASVVSSGIGQDDFDDEGSWPPRAGPPNRDVCGKSFVIMPRLSGSYPAEQSDFPWLTRIQYVNAASALSTCGAAVIADEWVLTTAHCFPNLTSLTDTRLLNFLRGVEGHRNTFYGRRDARPLKFSRIVVHPNFIAKRTANTTSLFFDFALLQLTEKLDFSMDQLRQPYRPVCLIDSCEQDVEKQGALCVLGGWGTNRGSYGLSPMATWNKQYDDNLQKTVLPMINRAECQQSINQNLRAAGYRNQNQQANITDDMTCFGYRDGYFDDCQGDVGTPIVCRSWQSLSFYLKGMDSFGFGCELPPGFFRMFSRPCIVMDWIRETTGQEFGAPLPTTTTRRATTTTSTTTRATTTTTVDPDTTDFPDGENFIDETTSTKSTPWRTFTEATVSCGTLASSRNTGRAGVQDRAPAEVVPWQARVFYQVNIDQLEYYYCGAAILSRRWLITSKNCKDRTAYQTIATFPVRSALVFAGVSQSFESSQRDGLRFRVAKLIDHPTKDITLVKLEARLDLGQPDIIPICLPDCVGAENPAGQCSLSGWGNIYDRVFCPLTDIRSGLRIRNVNVTQTRSGQFSIRNEFRQCDGDVGGPLACMGNSNSPYSLYGVVTFNSNSTVVFAEQVCTVKEWILQRTNNLDDQIVLGGRVANVDEGNNYDDNNRLLAPF